MIFIQGQNILISDVREAESKKRRGRKKKNKGKPGKREKKSFRKVGNRNQGQNKRNGKKIGRENGNGKGREKGKERKGNEKKETRKGGKALFNEVNSRQAIDCNRFYDKSDTKAVRDFRYARNQIQKAKRAKKRIEKLDKLFQKAATAFQAGATFYRDCSDPRAVPVYEGLRFY